MSGLAYNSNGVKTTYVGTKYNFNAGTSRICVRTAAGAGGVLTYPLTSDSSASQYCKIKVNINGTPCYLATQSLIQTVKNTLPTASIVEQHQGQLLLNQYTDFVFDSYSESEYTETNSVSSGTSVTKEIVTWDGSFIPDASDYYKPYTYYRYTNRVKRQVPVYKVRNNYNYSETTSYKLSVDGLGTYTSSLPYNTFGVTSESSAPVLYNQQQKQIVTNTTPEYGYKYSTNVLPPYLYTDSMTLYLRPGNELYTTEYQYYVDQYTNPNNLPSNITLIDSEPQVIEHDPSYIGHNVGQGLEQNGNNFSKAAHINYNSYIDVTKVNHYSTELEIIANDPPAFTGWPVYQSVYNYGVRHLKDRVSSLKTTLGQKQLHGVNVNSGVQGTISHRYQEAVYQTEKTLIKNYQEYTSTKKKNNTDIELAFVENKKVTNCTSEITSYGRPKESSIWDNTEITSRKWINYSVETESFGSMELSRSEGALKPRASRTSTYSSYADIFTDEYKFIFGDYMGTLSQYSMGGTLEITHNQQAASAKFKYNGVITQHNNYNTYSTTVDRSNWPERTVSPLYTYTSIKFSFTATVSQKYYGAHTMSYTLKNFSSWVCTLTYYLASYTKGTATISTQKERLYVTGDVTSMETRNRYVSGQKVTSYEREYDLLYSYTYNRFTDAYYWEEEVDNNEYHTLATVRAKYKKQTSDSEYTFRTSQVSEVNTYTTLSTYTTAHTYSLDTLVNNANV